LNINDVKRAVSEIKEKSPQRKFEESVEIAVNLKDVD